MLAPIGPTLDTTYMLQLHHDDGSWVFYSAAEYTSVEGCKKTVTQVYGGAFAGTDRHRVVKIERAIVEELTAVGFDTDEGVKYYGV